jgi:hypothetical protein
LKLTDLKHYLLVDMMLPDWIVNENSIEIKLNDTFIFLVEMIFITNKQSHTNNGFIWYVLLLNE